LDEPLKNKAPERGSLSVAAIFAFFIGFAALYHIFGQNQSLIAPQNSNEIATKAQFPPIGLTLARCRHPQAAPGH